MTKEEVLAETIRITRPAKEMRISAQNKLDIAKTKKDYTAIVDILFPYTDKFTPKFIQETDDLIHVYGHIIIRIYDKNSEKHGELAYMLRKDTKKFCIWINSCVERPAFPFLDLHEKGHVIFDHTINTKRHEESFYKRVEAEWTKISKYFTGTALEKYSKKRLSRYLLKQFSNIAMDMEINSKLFPDWNIAKPILMRQVLLAEINADDLKRPLKEMKLRIDLKDSEIRFCHPENYNWPHYLDWSIYLGKLLDNIEEFVKKIAYSSLGDKEKNEEKSTGDSIDDGLIGDEDLERDEQQEKTKEKAIEENGDDDEFDILSGNSRWPGKQSGTTFYEKTIFVDSLKDLERILSEYSLSKRKIKLETNTLWNANRGKEFGGIIVPKRRFADKRIIGTIQILLDVSGSVSEEVKYIIKTIEKTSGTFNKNKSHIICWDTSLKSDQKLSSNIELRRYGGGTDMAKGIRYIVNRGYIKSKFDKLFIISDFYDDLTRWIEEANKIKCDKAAIRIKDKGESNEKMFKSFFESELTEDGIRRFYQTFDVFAVNVETNGRA